MTLAMPELDQEVMLGTTPDTPWSTILWNDDVNTFPYVIKTLQIVLQKDKDTCQRYAELAHEHGKATVFTGAKEEAQDKATQLGAAGLWASVERV